MRDAIVAVVPDATQCDRITSAHLASIRTTLALNQQELTSLRSGDFDGLYNLRGLRLDQNQICSLPTGIFADLRALEQLDLSGNHFSILDADSFTGLSQLTHLKLSNNNLVKLPPNLLDGLTELTHVDLSNNDLAWGLPVNLFAGLVQLTHIDLSDSGISWFWGPDFSGLTKLESVHIGDDGEDQFDLTLTIDWVGSDYAAAVSTAAPFPIDVTITKTGYDAGVVTTTIPAGSTQSPPFQVARLRTDDFTLPGTRIEISDHSQPPTTMCDDRLCYSGFSIEASPWDSAKLVPHHVTDYWDWPELEKPAPATPTSAEAYADQHPCTDLPPILTTVTPERFAEEPELIVLFPAPSGECLVEVRLRLNPNSTPSGSCTPVFHVQPTLVGLDLQQFKLGSCSWLQIHTRHRIWRLPPGYVLPPPRLGGEPSEPNPDEEAAEAVEELVEEEEEEFGQAESGE